MEISVCTLFFRLVGASLLLSIPVGAQTNDPFSIRVESNLVLIHAQVYDKKQDPWQNHSQDFLHCRIESMNVFRSLPLSQPFTPPDCYRFMVVHDLGAGDFHVLEDGVEQKIESVLYEREPLFTIRDNRGIHLEWSHTPRAKWSSIDLGAGWIPVPLLHSYRLAYVPSNPEKGKCRTVRVTVQRQNAAVYATNQYCYIENPASDPLNETIFGKQLEADLNSDKQSKLPLSVQAVFFYTHGPVARIDTVLTFPWERLKHNWEGTDLHANIGVLGVVYKKDGTVAARFSDFACCASETRWLTNPESIAGNLPSHFEAQIELPTGAEYELRVVLSDGKRFGRVVLPLVVDGYDGKQLAISSVVLCDRYRDAKVANQEAAAVNLAPRYTPLVSTGLQFTPTAQTHFKSSDHPIVYFEVYEPMSGGQPNLEVKTQVKVLDARTGETRFHFAADSATYDQPDSSALTFAGDLSIAKLPPGDYRVEAQATDSAGHTTAVRSASFSIQF